MCMHKTDFSLKFNKKEKYYYGVGYKQLEKSCLTAYGNAWHEAKGFKSLKDAQNAGITTIGSDDNKNYIGGFHIFLNKKDAEKYSSNPLKTLVTVQFKEILSYGTNVTYVDYQYKPCIIARYMRIMPIRQRTIKEPVVESKIPAKTIKKAVKKVAKK